MAINITETQNVAMPIHGILYAIEMTHITDIL